jgi:hypothetical protein
MPFGMNTHIIGRLASWNTWGKCLRRPYLWDMEVGFWQSLFYSAIPEARKLVSEIALAKNIGFVLSIFDEVAKPLRRSHISVFDDYLTFNVLADTAILVRQSFHLIPIFIGCRRISNGCSSEWSTGDERFMMSLVINSRYFSITGNKLPV